MALVRRAASVVGFVMLPVLSACTGGQAKTDYSPEGRSGTQSTSMPGEFYKPRLITGDYFLERPVPAGGVIEVGAERERQKTISKEMEELAARLSEVEERSSSSPGAVAPEGSPSHTPSLYERTRTRLEAIERLRDEGLITADEYEGKRQTILKDL